jgi:hypothetical protein
MRQWLVDPKIMCKQHLLGEHCEHHMMVGAIKKKKQFDGYIAKNCVELTSLKERHDEIVQEMERRGYNHKTSFPEYDISYLKPEIANYKIRKEESFQELMNRCPKCKTNKLKML